MKYKSNGSHYKMASKEITINQLVAGDITFDMESISKLKDKGIIKLSISNFKRKEIIEFTDYLKGGLNLTQFMGIDFTGSNGHPKDKGSLHYFSPGNLNQYQRAILSLGEILEKYNSSGIIPCYGFGAKLPNGIVSYNFPINLNPENPFLLNYGQVFQCYQNVLNQISFSGPTNFAPLLRDINAFTQNNMNANIYNYTIYTIITDGAISDMDDTVIEIVKGSRLPLSIVIIGKFLFYLNLRCGNCKFFKYGSS